MARGSLLHHPSGRADFGIVPEASSRDTTIPEGPILLFEGEHTGPNRGFGAAHIWAEHQREMARLGLMTYDDVPAFVAEIVRAGSPIFYEGPYGRALKVAVVRSSAGTAILQAVHRRDGVIWSVVTAYAGNKTHGTRIGTVR